MKKLLLFTIVSLFTLGSYAQLKVIETEPEEQIGKVGNWAGTFLEATKRGDTHTISYQDTKFQHITDFKHFSMNEKSFNELYELILQNWNNPPEEDIMIDLGESGYVWLDYTKVLGITNVRFNHSVDRNAEVLGISQWMSKKKLEKLFGK